jgi:hypothetical protein
MDHHRELFAIQGSLVMNQLELLMAETDRILRDLGVSIKPFSPKIDTKVDVDVYKCVLEDAPPRKRIKIE